MYVKKCDSWSLKTHLQLYIQSSTGKVIRYGILVAADVTYPEIGENRVKLIPNILNASSESQTPTVSCQLKPFLFFAHLGSHKRPLKPISARR